MRCQGLIPRSSQLTQAEASLELYNLLFLDSQVVRTEGDLELWNLLLLPFTAEITGVARAYAFDSILTNSFLGDQCSKGYSGYYLHIFLFESP